MLIGASALSRCRDAMGANAVNTAAETIAPRLENRRVGRASAYFLAIYRPTPCQGEVAIPSAARHTRSAWASRSPGNRRGQCLRGWPIPLCQHNKGIFNGIDAVLRETIWRAVEAGPTSRQGILPSPIGVWSRTLPIPAAHLSHTVSGPLLYWTAGNAVVGRHCGWGDAEPSCGASSAENSGCGKALRHLSESIVAVDWRRSWVCHARHDDGMAVTHAAARPDIRSSAVALTHVLVCIDWPPILCKKADPPGHQNY